MDEQNHRSAQVKTKEEMDVTLRKLQVLRGKISELRAQCEELRRLSLKDDSLKSESSGLLCSRCGEAIEPGQEIIIKSSDDTEKKHYHKDCFRLLWV